MITPGVTNLQDVLSQSSNYTEWTSWTPVYTPGSGSFGAVTTDYAKYLVRGNDVLWRLKFTITVPGTGAGYIMVTLPPFTPVLSICQPGLSVTGSSVGYLLQTIVTIANYLMIVTPTNGNPIISGRQYYIQGRYPK